MVDTLKARIALEGARDIATQLQALGKAGEQFFKQFETAAKVDVARGLGASLDRVKLKLREVSAQVALTGQNLQRLGRSLSLTLTAPIAGAGFGGLKLAADFERQVNDFVANTGVAGKALDAAKQKSIDLGNASVFSATEAASAMTELAKIGVDFKDIMGGAADAVVNLAAANGAQLAPSAKIVGDLLKQFGLQISDLPAVVNEVTGALIQSKLDFDDYRLAIGQAGGAAGALGVKFRDFNAAIAATASSFASGSDAGTSFKTFINSLVPKSDQAAAAMQELGLQFFDAQGNMKSMAEIAQELQDKLGKLSQENLNEKLHVIFGTDAMRTAISLMQQGRKGIEDMLATIEKTDGAALAATRVKGLAGAMDQLKSAFESLAIAIGDSGVLKFVTDLVLGLTDFVKQLSKASPEVLKWGAAIAAIVALLGPFLVTLGLAATGFSVLVAGVGRLAGAFVALRVASAFLVGNPLIAGLAALAAIIIHFATESTKAAAAVTGQKQALEELARAQDAVRAGIPGAVADLEKIAAAHRKVAEAAIAEAETEVAMATARAQRTGGDRKDVLKALQAAKDMLAQLKKDLADYNTAAASGSVASTNFGRATTAAATAAANSLRTVVAAAQGAGNAATEAAGKVGVASDEIGKATFGAVRRLADAGKLMAASTKATLGAVRSLDSATPTVDKLQASIRDILRDLGSANFSAILPDIANLATTFFGSLGTVISEAAAQIQAATANIISQLQAAVAEAQRLAAAAQAAAAAAASAGAGGGGGNTQQLLAGGGPVWGAGTGTSDSILARLSNGEFVINARATRFWGLPFLAAINAMLDPLRGFSIGGLADGVSRSVAMPAIPRFAGGGLALAGLTPGRTVQLELKLGDTNEIFQTITDEEVVGRLARAATRERMLAIGRPPKRIAR